MLDILWCSWIAQVIRLMAWDFEGNKRNETGKEIFNYFRRELFRIIFTIDQWMGGEFWLPIINVDCDFSKNLWSDNFCEIAPLGFADDSIILL